MNALAALGAPAATQGIFPAAAEQSQTAPGAAQPEIAALIRLLGDLLDTDGSEAMADLEAGLDLAGDANPAAPETGAIAALPPTATPQQIAQALIRSMLAAGSARAAEQIALPFAEAPTDADVEIDAETVLLAALRPEPPQTPEAQEPGQVAAAKPAAPPTPRETVASEDASNTPSTPGASQRAPLAFGLRLTPAAQQATAQTQAPGTPAAPPAAPKASEVQLPEQAAAADGVLPAKPETASETSAVRPQPRKPEAAESKAPAGTVVPMPQAQASRNGAAQNETDSRGQRDPQPESQHAAKPRPVIEFPPGQAARAAELAGTPQSPVSFTPAATVAHAASPNVPQTAPADAAAALRNADPVTPAADVQPAAATSTPEIALRIARPDAAPVDVRFIERAGRVRVDVRTADAGLQTSLRQDLGTLVDALEQTGYRAEAFTPHDGALRTAAFAGLDSGAHRAQVHQTFHAQNHGNEGGNEGGNGGGDPHSGSRQQQFSQQQQPQHHRRQMQARWMEVLEKVA